MLVARLARMHLRLDQVWLLVSPGNPLKAKAGMAPLSSRLRGAEALADGRRVLATDIERVLRTRYTIDTVRLLRRRFPNVPVRLADGRRRAGAVAAVARLARHRACGSLCGSAASFLQSPCIGGAGGAPVAAGAPAGA